MTSNSTDSVSAESTAAESTAAESATSEPEMLGAPPVESTDGSVDPTAVKDPSDWVTGGEPATGAQKSYLDTLAREAGEQIPADITKAEASEHIDRLQSATGRGQSADENA